MPKVELINTGDKLYPAAVTNYSLSMGEKLGLLKGSMLPDLLNCESMMTVIYLSIIGVNKRLDYSFDHFLKEYQPNDYQLLQNYRSLIMGCSDIKENNFAKGLINSTSKSVGKDQKKVKPPKLDIQFVEDRYVLYCLAYGIDHDIFWHYPIPDVERIYESKKAFDGWSNNPKTQ